MRNYLREAVRDEVREQLRQAGLDGASGNGAGASGGGGALPWNRWPGTDWLCP